MRSLQLLSAAFVALLLSASLAVAGLYPGTYKAKEKGLSVKLEIGENGGLLAYSMKTACSKDSGKIELSKGGPGLKGREVSRGPKATLRTTTAKVALSRDGSELSGCHATRRFAAGVEQSDGFVPTRDLGHYSGSAGDGLPISFDVVEDDGEFQLENLGADVLADCYDVDDPAAEEVPMVTHIRGISGPVPSDGSFYIDHTPDEETEYEFFGELGDEAAEVEVIIGGRFDAAGNPSPDGQYACDSWGEIYAAARG